MVFNNMQWPIEKTRQVIWDALQGYGRIEWKRTCMDLEKTLDVAYQDILNKFDLTWGVKGLIMTQNNSVVTWKDRPQMSIISCFPLGLLWLARVDCILGSFAIECSICAQKRRLQEWSWKFLQYKSYRGKKRLHMVPLDNPFSCK